MKKRRRFTLQEKLMYLWVVWWKVDKGISLREASKLIHISHKQILDWKKQSEKMKARVTSMPNHGVVVFNHFSLCIVEFWGLPRLIPLLQYVNRLGFEICSVKRTRKLGYVNLNWPRCSARVTESLALTDGSFCRKQNTLYFRLCKNVSL